MRVIIPIGSEIKFKFTDIQGIITQAIIGKCGVDYNVGYWIDDDYNEAVFSEDQLEYDSDQYLSLVDKV